MSQLAFPNESPEYRDARNRLLEAEAALRGQLEAVAQMRRALPPGGVVPTDYVFDEMIDGQARPVRLSELFATGLDSLFLYGFMYGPAMKEACPLCTSFLDSLDGNINHLRQRMNVAVVARSPIERLRDFASARGWQDLRLLSSANTTFHADYFAEDEAGNQWPMANVFVRRDGVVHHFWGSELLHHPFGGGDPRHVDLLWPLWNVLDLTPDGRGTSWYPSLAYEVRE